MMQMVLNLFPWGDLENENNDAYKILLMTLYNTQLEDGDVL